MSNQNENTGSDPTLLGWAIRIISVALLAGLALYLVTQALEPTNPVTLTVKSKPDEARTQNGQTLMPVEITNEGSATIRDMEMNITAGSEKRSVTIKMLGQSESITYTIDTPSPTASVEYEIISYESE